MRTAVAYLRVSGKSQVDGDGPERQEATIRAYARDNDIRIVKIFFEAGVSGTVEGFDRPQWVEMLDWIDTKDRPKLILIEKLDRLARDIIVQEHILRDLKRRSVTMLSVTEPDMCSDDPTRTLMRQIMGAIADWDRKMIAQKMLAAKARIRARGERADGAFPYGSHPKYPQEAQILQEIHLLKQKGLCDAHITRELNAKGLPTRSGKPWQQMTVRTILRRAA